MVVRRVLSSKRIIEETTMVSFQKFSRKNATSQATAVWFVATVAMLRCEGRLLRYDKEPSEQRNGSLKRQTESKRRLDGRSSFPLDPSTTELKASQNENEVQHLQQFVAEAIGGAFFDSIEQSFMISSDTRLSEKKIPNLEHDINALDDNDINNEDAVEASPAIGHLDFRGKKLVQFCKEYFHSAQVRAHSKPISSYVDLYMGENTMFTTLPEGDLILWNASPQPESDRIIMQISAFNSMLVMDEKDDTTSGDFTWQYLSPHAVSGKHGDLESITQTKILNDQRQEYVALPLWGRNGNFWYDYIGMIAYLRQKLPTTTKLILVDDASGFNRRNLEALDANFAHERVVWMTCPTDDSICNQRIQVRGGGTLTVVKPPVSMRHLSLFKSVREWVEERFPGSGPNSSIVHKKVIYFMQEQLSEEENETATKMVEHFVSERMPDHNVVALHTHHFATLPEVMKLMSTASIIVGATSSLPSASSDFAPLFLKSYREGSSVENAKNKPKVLEFLFPRKDENEGITLATPSLYQDFSAMPWAEYHYLVAGKIDFRELEQALQSIIVGSA